MTSRADGERERIRHLASNLKAMLGTSLEMVVREGHGASEVGQNIALAAVDLAGKLAKLEAYTFVEKGTADRDVTPQKRLTPKGSRWRLRADLASPPVEIVEDPENSIIRYTRAPNADRFSMERLDFVAKFVRIVCTTCDDTHRMPDTDTWACTSCPTPCAHCRVPQGAFCLHTPCACSCHIGKVWYL